MKDQHKGVQVNIRLHPDLLKQLKRCAQRNHISMNAEISKRLSESIVDEKHRQAGLKSWRTRRTHKMVQPDGLFKYEKIK